AALTMQVGSRRSCIMTANNQSPWCKHYLSIVRKQAHQWRRSKLKLRLPQLVLKTITNGPEKCLRLGVGIKRAGRTQGSEEADPQTGTRAGNKERSQARRERMLQKSRAGTQRKDALKGFRQHSRIAKG